MITCTAPVVIDGDGLRCAGAAVRLAGVDAPEMHGPSHDATYPVPPPRWAAESARHRLAELTRRGVQCEPSGRSYQRVVATCRTPEGRDVGGQLVREGLAVEWRRYSHGRYTAD